MKKITLSNGMEAIVDDADYPLLNRVAWHYSNGSAKGQWGGGKSTKFMHRVIMDAPPGLTVDHIDHNRLNNQRNNLRLCTIQENNWNRPKSPNIGSSRYKGVSRCKGKWRAAIKCNDRFMKIGQSDCEEDAAVMYNVAAQLFFGEYAYLNPV